MEEKPSGKRYMDDTMMVIDAAAYKELKIMAVEKFPVALTGLGP